MGLLAEISRAKDRALGLDLQGLADRVRDTPPIELAAPQDLAARRDFLHQNLADPSLAELTFERIVEGNELQPVNYLELGALAARAVCRLKLLDSGGFPLAWGTGFLVAPGVLLTNNHVFPSAQQAGRSLAQFDVELDVFGADKPMAEFQLQPERLFFTDPALDFSVVAVAPASADGAPLSAYGFLPLVGVTGKVVEGEWLTIVQHPGGERKQVCIRENRLLTRTDDVLWYSTDTLGGSSGAPVFNNSWQVVALHHKGVPEEKNGRIQTLDGRDFDPGRDAEATIKWIANEGIRVSRIVQTLKTRLPDHPLMAEIFDMTPAHAREVTQAMLSRQPVAPPPVLAPQERRSPAMRRVTLTLDIGADGSVAVHDTRANEGAWLERTPERSRGRDRAETVIEVPFDFDYANRNGFQENFLGPEFLIHLPEPAAPLHRIAAPLLTAKPNSSRHEDYVLKYWHLSVMMHARRRLALWTAANVDGGGRYKIGRTPDTWRWDDRISRDHQLGNFYYAKNQFDRGHLTRREDMEFGPSLEAAVAQADDTCHWTNCTPQHSKFNGLAYIWQDLEQHILERAIKAHRFAAQVFTGPVLDEGDPSWSKFPEIQYPVKFWKIGVAVSGSGELFAAGFVLDQSAVVERFGIEAAPEVPFAPFQTYQTPIADIEDMTGLRFSYSQGGQRQSLRDADPLATSRGRAAAAARRRASRSTGAYESLSASETPSNWAPLDADGGIIL